MIAWAWHIEFTVDNEHGRRAAVLTLELVSKVNLSGVYGVCATAGWAM